MKHEDEAKKVKKAALKRTPRHDFREHVKTIIKRLPQVRTALKKMGLTGVRPGPIHFHVAMRHWRNCGMVTEYEAGVLCNQGKSRKGMQAIYVASVYNPNLKDWCHFVDLVPAKGKAQRCVAVGPPCIACVRSLKITLTQGSDYMFVFEKEAALRVPKKK